MANRTTTITNPTKRYVMVQVNAGAGALAGDVTVSDGTVTTILYQASTQTKYFTAGTTGKESFTQLHNFFIDTLGTTTITILNDTTDNSKVTITQTNLYIYRSDISYYTL